MPNLLVFQIHPSEILLNFQLLLRLFLDTQAINFLILLKKKKVHFARYYRFIAQIHGLYESQLSA